MISEVFSSLVDSVILGRKPAGNGVLQTPPELAVRKGHPRPRSAPKLTGPAPSAAPGRAPGLTLPGRRCPCRTHLGLKSWKKPRRFIAAPLPGAHGAAPPPLQGLACRASPPPRACARPLPGTGPAQHCRPSQGALRMRKAQGGGSARRAGRRRERGQGRGRAWKAGPRWRRGQCMMGGAKIEGAWLRCEGRGGPAPALRPLEEFFPHFCSKSGFCHWEASPVGSGATWPHKSPSPVLSEPLRHWKVL